MENKHSGKHSDVGSKQGLDYQRMNSLQQSSAFQICQSKELCVSPSSQTRRSLEHCITAPVVTRRNLFGESQEKVYCRSMTEKRESPKPESRLKNLLANLVKIQRDGTVEVDLTKSEPVALELLELHSVEGLPCHIDYITTDFNKSVPKLKITMLVVGTRGDVQPFLAVAKRLQEFGHHVRLATHDNFSSFVKSAGVDFYPLGGDPRVWQDVDMARNKGLIPSAPGEISIQRKQLKAIIESLLSACTGPDIESGRPFRAQAIIANPPAYGHAHVAEALGIPLHIFFTMPWTPTQEFPHPWHVYLRVLLSYIVVDLLRRKLKLAPIAYLSLYHGSISHFPTAYMWSPHVVPKPEVCCISTVSVVGIICVVYSVQLVPECLCSMAELFSTRGSVPPEEFVKWIQKGPQPIYIGFGSMKTTDIILEALEKTGQRGIIDQGWGDLGTLFFCLVDCPHDWLFPQCLAVVHHGGAGTTATGLRAGCPTTVVPFFGDQCFWGERIYQKGLGPAPIPYLSSVKSRAMEIAELIENEDGVAAAVDAFHRHLPTELPPPRSLPEEDDEPNPIQWFFIQIGKLCCLPCGGHRLLQ
ncbi:Sterol 3-beta-glucosyltransferase [Bertholletia excelsa]